MTKSYNYQAAWLDELRKKTMESDKNWGVAICLSFFFGFLGLDRLYLDQLWLGLFKFLTFGGIGIWWFIDLILLFLGQMKDADGKIVTRPF